LKKKNLRGKKKSRKIEERKDIMKKAILFVYIVLVFLRISGDQPNETSVSIDQKLDSIAKELEEIESECAGAKAKYLNPLMLNRDYKEPVLNKMKKADFYFDKEDYISSGSIYYSIVISQESKDQIWEDAVYKLAESLFRNRNYISSARYFEMLVTDVKNSKYKIESLKRLISASYHLGDYSVAKKYYTEFVEIGYDMSKDQDLIYFLAKSLFYDNQVDEATTVFSTVSVEGAYYPQSQYFLGVIKLRKGLLQEALPYFEKVAEITQGSKYYKFERVFDLSVIAAARTAFELGDLVKSVKYYVMLDKRSEHFAEAYYELCWTYIKKEEYVRAIDALRLIKYIAPDSIVAPKAEILEGSLLIKLRRYGEAMVIFDQVVKKYSTIRDELSTIDNKSFLLNAKSGKLSKTLSPYSPVVRSLLKDNKKFSSAMKLSDDISELEAEINRVNQLESKIGSIVDNKNAASLFPPLKEGSSSALFLQSRIASIRNELIELRKTVIWNVIDEKDKKKFNQLEKEKSDLTGIIENAPISPDQIEKKASEYANMIISMEEEIHRIIIQTNSLYNQLDGISIFYAKTKGSLPVDDKLLERINREKSEILKSLDFLAAYKKEVESEKNRLVLGGDIISRVILARNSLNKIISKQDKILSYYDEKVSGTGDKIKYLIEKSQTVDSKLEKFYADLNDAVKEIINKIRVSYENEKNNLNEYKSELFEIKREITEMAELAMYSNINRVKSSFSDLILQADLGIIDVAWGKKEEATSEKLKLKTQKALEIRQLYLNLEGDE